MSSDVLGPIRGAIIYSASFIYAKKKVKLLVLNDNIRSRADKSKTMVNLVGI